jgi:hypothetical protein
VEPGRKALLIATYEYRDEGLRRLAAPAEDARALAEVLRDPEVAGFDVTMLVNEPLQVVGEAIGDFYRDCRRDELTLLYFSGHGLKDDEGRLYLAMTNTRRDALLFTGLSAAQINEAMEACLSRRKILVLDCCYSGAFPAGATAKADETVHALERFQGKGRAVLTASDATQYSFEGDTLQGSGTRSVFTRHLVQAIRSGEADLDADGDIALDELYTYVRDRVVAEMPQQRPKKQEDVDGRIVVARNVHWTLPDHLRYAIESPIAAQRLGAVDELAHLHRVGNGTVRTAVTEQLVRLAEDDSRSVSTAATDLLVRLGDGTPRRGATLPIQRPAPVEVAAPATAVVPPRAPRPEPPVEPPAEAPAERPAAGPAREPVPARRNLVLAALLVAAALLTASRYLVFERVNGYPATDVGWTTASWTLQVTVPFVLAAGLLLAPRDRLPAAALGCGLLAGTVVALAGELLGWAAIFPSLSYAVGQAWWGMLLGALVLTAGVVVACLSPWLRGAPRLRRDPVAVVAGLLVAAALGIWLLAVGSLGLPPGEWLFYKGAGILFTLVCLPVAVLALAPLQRLFALAAVTVVGVSQVAGATEILVHHTSGFDMGAVLRALLAVLVSLAACYAGQLLPSRGTRPEREVVTG